MNEKNTKKVDEMKALLKSYGFREDRWGNMKKTASDGGEMRYKFGDTSYKLEFKVGDRWVRMSGDYYKNVEVRGGKICKKK